MNGRTVLKIVRGLPGCNTQHDRSGYELTSFLTGGDVRPGERYPPLTVDLPLNLCAAVAA